LIAGATLQQDFCQLIFLLAIIVICVFAIAYIMKESS
jgi:flagellar biogenesis protein FliO